MIQNGEVLPGERLASVQQLAEQFQVGRSAVREALSALRAIGLIEIRQGEGSFVRKVDHDLARLVIPAAAFMRQEDIRQLFEIRKIIETGAAALAAENRTEGDLLELKTHLVDMQRTKGEEGLDEKADIQFHLAIVKSTKNQMLSTLLATVSETMQSAMREARKLFFYREKEKLDQLYLEHLAIYEAIEAQDSARAYQAMMTHIMQVEQATFKT